MTRLPATEQELFDLEELCTRFEQAWSAENAGVLIERYLEQVEPSQQPHVVEELIAIECELLRGIGRAPTRDEYQRRFPTWPTEVEFAFESHLTAAQEADASRLAVPERVGDYRIVREIGRGGMGVVYEAVQESLGRPVAIKLLSAHPLHLPEAVERFQREARAVGTLHHSNIVEVHGTGQQDGLHYYAMQLVEGKSLSRVIAELRGVSRGEHAHVEANGNVTPDPLLPAMTRDGVTQKRSRWPKVADIGLQVARALSYAHGRGVLHRDIKPANLLLDRGTVLVTDFGLAKFCQEDVNVTRTGDIVGTLRYLPPEALNGRWDERGDVYGLGLTLYELLTLRPAFPETDRSKLLDSIVRGDPPPHPRSVDPTIPRDLNTIVMKSIARAPVDRYQSAGDLAYDLTRFRHGRPITARRASAIERFSRWSRRNPAVAALIALVTLVAVVGFPTVALLWQNAVAAQQTAESERQLASAIGYASSLQLAQSFIRQHNPDESRLLLKGWASDVSSPAEASSDNVVVRQNSLLPYVQRGWEWNFLRSRLDGSLQTLVGHADQIFFIAMRPDGAQVATVGAHERYREPGWQSIVLWDLKSGRPNHIFGVSERVESVCYSPDGRLLAAIGPKLAIYLWDVKSGELRRTLPPPATNDRLHTDGHFPPRVSFSSDGRWLLSTSNPVIIRDTNTWQVERQWKGFVATFLPDASHVVVFRHKDGDVYELDSGEVVRRIRAPRAVEELSCSADGKTICGRSGGGFRLWTLPAFERERDISARDIYWSSLSPDGEQLACVDPSGVLQLLRLNSNDPPLALTGHEGMLRHGVFSADGSRLYTCGDDRTVRVWDTGEPPWRRVIQTETSADRLGDLVFASDGRSLLCAKRWDASDNAGKLFRIEFEQGEQQTHLLNLTYRAKWPRTDFTFSHNGDWLAAPAPEETHPGEKIPIGYAESGRVNIWSTETGQLVHTLPIESNTVTSIAWSRDDTKLAVASHNDRSTITVFELADLNRQLRSTSTLQPSPPRGLREPRLHTRFVIDEHPVTAMSFSHTKGQIAASTGNGTYVWDVTRAAGDDSHAKEVHGNEPESFFPHPESASFLDWSPKEHLLASAYRREQLVRVYNIDMGVLENEIDAPRQATCVRFSPNGRRLAIVGYDSLVHFCDAASGHRLLTLHGRKSNVGRTSLTVRVAFSSDGRRIATNDFQGRITVWEAEPMGQ